MQVTIHQARTQLSKRIAAAERGEEVVITCRDKAVVQLNPVRELRTSSVRGGYCLLAKVIRARWHWPRWCGRARRRATIGSQPIWRWATIAL